MQNKKTVVIFGGEENRDTCFAIKEYLLEDKSVLPIIIASEELNNAVVNIAEEKIVGETSRLNAAIDAFGKLRGGAGLNELPKKTPEYNNDKTAHKKMRNIFKRYTPDVVLCLNARCLRAAIAVKNFLRADARIAVYLSEFLPDRSFIYPEVDVFFALSETVKSGLVAAGAPERKIVVNPPVPRKRYLNEIDAEIAKGEFGLPKDKPTVLILANGYLNYRFSELVGKLNATKKEYSYLVYCGYDRTLLNELLKRADPNIVARNEGMDKNLAFSAADVVVARPRGETVAAAYAKERLMITYAPAGAREIREAGILSVDYTAAADDPAGVAEILDAYRDDPDAYRKHLNRMKSDPKEAGERLKDYIVALI